MGEKQTLCTRANMKPWEKIVETDAESASPPMAGYAWTGLPMATCPHCNVESQIDDYYELSAGSTFTCPACEKEIEILERHEVVEIKVKA